MNDTARTAAPTRRSMSRWLPWIALTAIGAGLSAHAALYRFVCDDAYISFRYSYNFAVHNELVFNLGERVEGYTNFLWTLVIGLLLKLGLRPEVTSLVLGALFGVASALTLWALTRVYRGPGTRSLWDMLGPALLASWGCFAVWSSSGLETMMFTSLSLGAITLYLAEQAGRVRGRYSGLLFALAAMTRPEGLLLFGLTGLHRLCANLVGRRLRPSRAELWWVAGFLALFGIFFAWRFAYYGYPLPNTFYVKGGGGWEMVHKWGLPYLWDFVHHNRFYALPLLLIAFRPGWAPSTDERDRPPCGSKLRPGFLWSYVALIVVSYSTYVTYVGGDFMAMGRFFAPIVPLLALFTQEALREIVDGASWIRRTPRPGRSAPRAALTAAIVLGASIVNSYQLYRANQSLRYYRWGLETIAYLRKFAADRIVLGRWMRTHLPKNTTYSVGGAGASVYASRLYALDVFGLTDQWIAHNVSAQRAGRPGHAKYAPLSYVLRRKTDLICHIGHHLDWPYYPSRGEANTWRRRGYRWVCLTPPDLRPSHYCCLKRIDRDLGPYLVEVDPR